MQEVSWALVTSVSPVEVRFVGDAADTPIGWILDHVTGLGTSDKVALAKLGSDDGWCIIGIAVRT